jgi:hypothetical protein
MFGISIAKWWWGKPSTFQVLLDFGIPNKGSHTVYILLLICYLFCEATYGDELRNLICATNFFFHFFQKRKRYTSANFRMWQGFIISSISTSKTMYINMVSDVFPSCFFLLNNEMK